MPSMRVLAWILWALLLSHQECLGEHASAGAHAPEQEAAAGEHGGESHASGSEPAHEEEEEAGGGHQLEAEEEHGHEEGEGDEEGGAHGGGGEHHHGGGHHGGPGQTAVGSALALSLLGTVAWIMSLFYFVNCRDKDVRGATWNILNAMVSIFLAVLAFKSSKDLSSDFFGERDAHGPHQLDMWSRILSIVRAIIAYLVWNVLLYLFRAWPQTRDAIGVIGGHYCGFSAIEVFGHILTIPLIASNFVLALLAIAVFGALMVAAYIGASQVRTLLTDQSEDMKEWNEQISENEDDSAALCLGLLVSMVMRSLVTGEMPPVHGQPLSKTQPQVWLLFGISIALAVGLMVSTALTRKFMTKHDRPNLWRVMDVVNRTFSLASGWCLLFWGQWLFWNVTNDKGAAQGSDMTARLIMSMAFSAIAFLGIVVVDKLADMSSDGVEHGLRAFLETLGLLMGLAWEGAFTSAVEGVGSYVEDAHYRLMIDAGLNFVLCAVVGPAWMWYLLPNAREANREEEEEEHGSPGSPKAMRLQCPACQEDFQVRCPCCSRAVPTEANSGMPLLRSAA